MKKILGLIGVLGLTTSTIATGVAMSPVQTIKDVEYEANNKGVETNKNEGEDFASVSPFYYWVYISARNCNLLKDLSRHSRWKWAINNGYSGKIADHISKISYNDLYRGWINNTGHSFSV